MLFKEFPYNAKTENQIKKEIKSNKILKNISYEELKDLINGMIKINENERITWKNYFNHNLFNLD
jgi:serine/threonine protein kinase